MDSEKLINSLEMEKITIYLVIYWPIFLSIRQDFLSLLLFWKINANDVVIIIWLILSDSLLS